MPCQYGFGSSSTIRGSTEGSTVGSIVGSTAGSIEGSTVGSTEGSKEGSIEGSTVGSIVGSTVGRLLTLLHQKLSKVSNAVPSKKRCSDDKSNGKGSMSYFIVTLPVLALCSSP